MQQIARTVRACSLQRSPKTAKTEVTPHSCQAKK